jgi:tRNA (guanine37-N1)-methyltransferase
VNGLLDYPHYTRPAIFEGKSVPEVLLNGNHRHINKWRLTQALVRTLLRRPDLLEKKSLSHEEQTLLSDYQQTIVNPSADGSDKGETL